MKYLDLVDLSNTLLDVLSAGKRYQLPKRKLDEINLVLMSIKNSLGNEIKPEISMTIEDLVGASLTVSRMDIDYLTDDMRQSLIEGVTRLKKQICTMAYAYYSVTEFEPLPEIIPIMKDVVKTTLAD